MRTPNDEPFIPPTCPALEIEDTAAYAGQGCVVTPSEMYVGLEGADAEYGLAREGEQPVFTHAYVWFSVAAAGVYAAAVSEHYRTGSPEDRLLDVMSADRDAERKLGERYCERIKECRGVFERAGELVCQALDPQDFIPEIRKIYPDS